MKDQSLNIRLAAVEALLGLASDVEQSTFEDEIKRTVSECAAKQKEKEILNEVVSTLNKLEDIYFYVST